MKSILLVADNNYIDLLVTQINSVHRHEPEAKIYLVHDLNKTNFSRISEFIYKAERFHKEEWDLFQKKDKNGHVSGISLGKFQSEIIEENHYLYLDTDAILLKEIPFEKPKTLSCDIKEQEITSKDIFFSEFKNMMKFIKEKDQSYKEEQTFKIYSDGAYFGNRDWMNSKFIPLYKEVRKEYLERKLAQRWFEMDYFQITCKLLKKIDKYKIIQAYPALEGKIKLDYSDIKECHIVHYLSKNKPHQFEKNKYIHNYGTIWWDYLENGPCK